MVGVVLVRGSEQRAGIRQHSAHHFFVPARYASCSRLMSLRPLLPTGEILKGRRLARKPLCRRYSRSAFWTTVVRDRAPSCDCRYLSTASPTSAQNVTLPRLIKQD